MTTSWDPDQYLRFADERARPFDDLVARIPASAPRTVVDLGCGPGNMTARLCERWPGARVLGIDSSEEMIGQAQAVARPPALTFERGDLRDWDGTGVDVITCAATLQWVPGHVSLLPRLAAGLAAGGVLAFQVPGNFDQPSHVLLHELAVSDRWRHRLGEADANAPSSLDPMAYHRALLRAAFARVDAWETTYLHLLSGPDAVLQWIKGTGLRPVLRALEPFPGETEQFLADYGAALRAAYPADGEGRVYFPFRRIFAVAVKPG